MKKYLILFVLIYICQLTLLAQVGYRYEGRFIELIPANSSARYVRILQNNKQKLQTIKAFEKKFKGDLTRIDSSSFILTNPGEFIGRDYYSSQIYSTVDGYKIIVLPRFAIKLRGNASIDEILKSANGELLFDREQYSIHMFNCSLTNSTEILSLNEKINQLDFVEWCEPMMITSTKRFNTLYSQQYYLHNIGQNSGTSGIDINVEPAWNTVTINDSLVVAILDDGVERNHEDLFGNVIDGYTIDYPNEKGDPINDFYDDYSMQYEAKAHGTACAGIVGALNNAIGIRGVASGVRLLPINIFPYDNNLNFTNFTEKLGDAIRWAYTTGGADIISCSWGFTESEYVTAAINDAASYGRDGKGTVFVCASGNDYVDYSIKYPANLLSTIAVGAIDKNGCLWEYSCGGPLLDVVAPSGDVNLNGDVVTTDRMGAQGYDNSNYTYSFGGTSAACPQVAGVAALVLSANPNLTQEQVKQILQCTARKLPDMFGENRTDDFGYGLVDAYGAVLVAQNWQDCNNCTLSGSSTVCSYETYTLTGVPSNVTVSWRFEGQTTTSPQMYPNSSNNTCGVTLGNNSFKGYLCADVQLQGYTMVTYKKLIEGGNNFIGYYWDDTEYMDVLWSDDNWVTPGHTISVHSEDLAGKTAKISRSSSPSNYTYLNILGTSPETRVEFYMPYLSNGEYLTLWISGTCGDSSFKFYAASSRNNSNLFTISEQGERRYMLSLSRQDVANNGKNKCAIINSDDDYWVFRVYNAATMQQVATELVKGDHYLLDATSWKSGIYIIRAYIGKVPYTAKISVK